MATSYTAFTLGLAKSDLSALGFTVYELNGADATQQNLMATILAFNPDLIVADGHGDVNVLSGQNREIVLRACTNDQILSGTATAAISCLTAQQLGPSARKKTAQSYAGFVNEFRWIVTEPYDPATDPCWVAHDDVIRTIIVATAKYKLGQLGLKQAYDMVNAKFESWKQYYGYGDGSKSPDAGDMLMDLQHNQSGFAWIGEETYGGAALMLPPLEIAIPLVLGIMFMPKVFGLV